jgi:hypothetical protein
MHLLLLLVGLALAAAGLAMLRYAVPIEDVAGAALFTSGVVALVGALIVLGLAAAVRSLNRIAERLYIQPLPLPPTAAVEREDPAPRATRAAPVPGADAARPSLLGWLGRAGASGPVRAPPAQSTAPTTTPAAAPPVDLAPLTRIAEPPREVLPPSPAPIPRAQPKPPAAPNGTPASTVYRSGVIDGMAYTLFMDGSIQAELPQGTVKFISVDELQKHLLGNRPS